MSLHRFSKHRYIHSLWFLSEASWCLVFHVTKEPETVVTGEETTTTDLLWKKHLWNCRYICFSFTTAAKSLVSLSEFQPSGLITLRKSRRAWRLNYFIPIQVSSALNRKLAVRRCRTDKCTIQQPNNNSQKIFSVQASMRRAVSPRPLCASYCEV